MKRSNKKHIGRFAKSSALAIAAMAATATLAKAQNWQLTFDDEFNSTHVNTSAWDYGLPWGNHFDPSEDAEAYNLTDPGVNNANVSESNGYLYLTATHTPYPANNSLNNDSPITQPYTSGCLTTFNKFSQEYGMFEMSAELPAGQGLWSGFWLLNAADTGPPEIDIFENFGNNSNRLYMTDHYDPNNTDNFVQGIYNGANYSTGFHLYSLVWTPSTLSWYVDNQLAYTVSNTSKNPIVSPADPMSVLLSLSVGGADSSPGPPNANTVFPASMIIDYVRVYTAVSVGGSITWNNSGGGGGDGQSWDVTSFNWNNGGYTPTVYTDGDQVTFSDTNNGNYAVTLNTTVSPGSLTFNNSAGNYLISGTGSIAGTTSLVKSGSGTLTLKTANTYTGGTTLNAGRLVAGVNGAVSDGPINITGGTLQLAINTSNTTVSSLSISGNGVLDVTNNTLFINYGSTDPIAAVEAYLLSGFNNGGWNGPGIISSVAYGHTYGLGYADGKDGVVNGLTSGEIEVKYTLYGDANLDGVVNGSDFSILAANFGQGSTNWDQGNFLFTPSVNGSDFAVLAGNFGQGDNGADVIPADTAALDAFAAANGLMADVPEPASTTLLLGTVLAAMTARRPGKKLRPNRVGPLRSRQSHI